MNFNWEMIAVGIDAALVIILYEVYKNRRRAAQAVKDADVYESGAELRQVLESVKTLSYAGVTGNAYAVGEPLKSQFDATISGVVQHVLLVEHKSQRNQGFWSNVKNVIRDSLTAVPFCLRGDKGDVVEVIDCLQASCLTSDLSVTHDEFTPTPTSGLLAHSLDRFFGDISRGVQQTERMLVTGTPLYGFGMLTLTPDGQVQLSPPSFASYILTTHSRDDIVQKLQSQASTIALITGIAVIAGVVIVGWWWRRRHIEQSSMSSVLDSVLARRVQNTPLVGEPCIVCLNQPRELVLLPCGHVCMCADCCKMLNSPAKCPICRTTVERVVATYMA